MTIGSPDEERSVRVSLVSGFPIITLPSLVKPTAYLGFSGSSSPETSLPLFIMTPIGMPVFMLKKSPFSAPSMFRSLQSLTMEPRLSRP